MNRLDVTFLSQGTSCAAWFYQPEGPAPYPCVILAHGLGATREMGLDQYARRFAQLGIAALIFDYRYFGDSAGEPRQLLDISSQLADWSSAIAYARTREDVDASRIALWGTSFSGGHVIVAAMRAGGIAAVISQIPFTDGGTASSLQKLSDLPRLLTAGLRDELRQLGNKPPYYIKVVGAPGTLAALTTPDAVPGFHTMAPQEHWYDTIAARALLHIGLYRPILSAPNVHCPVLFCICDKDRIISTEAALKTAQATPKSEVRHYNGGHFDIYVDPIFEQAVGDQCTFLKQHLLPIQRA